MQTFGISVLGNLLGCLGLSGGLGGVGHLEVSMSEQVQGGLVHIGGMLSFGALQRFAENRGYEEWLHSWIEPHWLAWLIALLKECWDIPELFPHGKWATIQHMESLLIEAARAELPLGLQRKEFAGGKDE